MSPELRPTGPKLGPETTMIGVSESCRRSEETGTVPTVMSGVHGPIHEESVEGTKDSV